MTNAVAREPGGALRRNENFSYAYDAAGNLQTRVNATLTQTFSVDNANRLTSASRSGTLTAAGTANTLAQSVMVNEVGADLYTDDTFATTNGLTLADGNNELRFKATDAQAQSVTITQIFNLPASVFYDYDHNGNLTSDGARSYDYDDANQLIRITAANQWKSEFVYDAFGRRIVRKEFAWQNGAWSQVDEVRYVWLGMSVLQERDAANNVRVTYTGRLAREDATSTSFYFADGNGNVSSLIDSSGNIKAKYRYDSFGNLISKSGALADANLVRFSGKEYHARSGLYYYGFRYYAPNLQRWMNEDPIGMLGGLNLHGFVGNDPINFHDPYGLWGLFSCEVSQKDWDRENAKRGAPLRNPRSTEDELDDALARTLATGRAGTFAGPGQWYDTADTSKEVGITALTAATPPPLKAVQVARIATTAKQLHQVEMIAEAGVGMRAERTIQEVSFIRTGKQPLMLPEVRSAEVLRNTPGLATARDLPIIREGQQWLRGTGADAGRVPGQIAKCLSGRSFNSWKEFREEFWKAVSQDPVLSRQFGPISLREMQAGRAPFAPPAERVGERVKYEIDHMFDIQNGGGVYDMNNLIIRTPVNHIGK